MALEYASPRLACAVIEDVHVAVHGPDNPDARDWEAYLAAARKILENYEQPRVLVYTHGGNPSGPQRGELNDINEGLRPRVAVMVDSRVARGAVTALSWFNPQIKAFSLAEIDDALAHLELTGRVAIRVKRAVTNLDQARLEASDG